MERTGIVVSTELGKEKRVLRDLLDLLFPYDFSVEGHILGGGRVALYTGISSGEVARLLRLHPIRGLLNAREIIGIYRDLEELTCRIGVDLCRSGVKVSKLRVRVKHGWSQEYYSRIKKAVAKIYDRENGLEILVEEFDGKIALEIFLFRPQYVSFGVPAKI